MPPTVPVSILPPGTALARFVMCLGANAGDLLSARVVSERFRDTPQVYETFNYLIQTKAAIPAGSTRDATWGSPLSPYGLATEAFVLLRAASIVETLAPRMKNVPLHVRIPHETGAGITGDWVGEGAPTPAQSTAFESVIQELYKIGVIVPLTSELMNFSLPNAEETVRRTVIGGVARSIDQKFLDPSITAVAGVRPASITNGATAITSTGATASAIAADLASMVAAITTPGSGLTWILRKKTLASIAAALGASSGLPATLWGIPVVTSDNAPAQITLVDCAAILFSDAGQLDIDHSRYAAPQLDSAPANPPTAATVPTSLWQNDLVGIKIHRWLAWQRVDAGSVSYMVVSY